MSWERIRRKNRGASPASGAHMTIRTKDKAKQVTIVLGGDLRECAGIAKGDWVHLDVGRDEHLGKLAVVAGATKVDGWRIAGAGGGRAGTSPSARLQFVAAHLGLTDPPELKQAHMAAEVGRGRIVLTLPEALRAALSRSSSSDEAAKRDVPATVEPTEATKCETAADLSTGADDYKTNEKYSSEYSEPASKPPPAPPERMVPRRSPADQTVYPGAWTEEESNLVVKMAVDEVPVETIAAHIGRTKAAVHTRISTHLKPRIAEAKLARRRRADDTVEIMRHGPARTVPLPKRNPPPPTVTRPAKPRPVDTETIEDALNWLETQGCTVDDGGAGRFLIDGKVMTAIQAIRLANDKRLRKGLDPFRVPETDENRMLGRGYGRSSLAEAI